MNIEKARFFGQYYGQRVLCIRSKEEPTLYVGFDDMQNNMVLDADYLLLKPLSSIDDADALEVLKICGIDHELEQYKDFYDMLKEQSNFMDYFFKARPLYFSEVILAYQYLQSKGYALPFLNYSVNQLVEKGWIKLKEE